MKAETVHNVFAVLPPNERDRFYKMIGVQPVNAKKSAKNPRKKREPLIPPEEMRQRLMNVLGVK